MEQQPAPLPARPRPDRNPVARFFRERVRPIFSRRLAALAAAVAPHIYVAYMRFVWATSRIVGAEEFRRQVQETVERHDGAVGILWHEEVMTVAWGYSWVGCACHTLASLGESGEVIARMLRMLGFTVFRGGSTTGRSRRREGAMRDMIEHMRTTPRVLYGITVDGSKGPRYRLKTGSVVIARECGRPLIVVRTWYRRCIRLGTWDRMAVPLPFNEIRYYFRGPFPVPADASTPEGLERFTLELENELIDLAARSYDESGQDRPAELVRRSGALTNAA